MLDLQKQTDEFEKSFEDRSRGIQDQKDFIKQELDRIDNK